MCLFYSSQRGCNWEISGPISAEGFILPSASAVVLSDTLVKKHFLAGFNLSIDNLFLWFENMNYFGSTDAIIFRHVN